MIRKQRYRNDYIIIIISGPLWSVSDRYGLLGKVDGDFSHTEQKKKLLQVKIATEKTTSVKWQPNPSLTEVTTDCN